MNGKLHDRRKFIVQKRKKREVVIIQTEFRRKASADLFEHRCNGSIPCSVRCSSPFRMKSLSIEKRQCFQNIVKIFFFRRKRHVLITMDADILLAEILETRQPPLMTFRIDKPHCPYRVVLA